MPNSTPKPAPKGAKPVPAPAPVPEAVPAAPAPSAVSAMSAPRYSAWHIVAIVAGILAVVAVACLAGAAIGFGYGRAATRAAVPFLGMHGYMLPGGDRQMPYGFDDETPYGMMQPRLGGAAYLGVTFQAVDADQAKQEGLSTGEGALVSTVVEGSPAASAGIQAGDIILAVDGERLVQTALLRHLIQAHAAGDPVSLLILRNGNEQTLDVTLGRASDSLTP